MQVLFYILYHFLNYLIFEEIFRKLKDRLEYHGVDYHTAAVAAATSNYVEATGFISEKVLQLPSSYFVLFFNNLVCYTSRQKVMLNLDQNI